MNLIEAVYEALQRSVRDNASWDVLEVERDAQYIVVSPNASKEYPEHLPTLRFCQGKLNGTCGTTLPMTTIACILEIAGKQTEAQPSNYLEYLRNTLPVS